jgi:hypothetical protein
MYLSILYPNIQIKIVEGEAIVLSLDASATGEYTVQYQDSKFSAFASKLSYQDKLRINFKCTTNKTLSYLSNPHPKPRTAKSRCICFKVTR